MWYIPLLRSYTKEGRANYKHPAPTELLKQFLEANDHSSSQTEFNECARSGASTVCCYPHHTRSLFRRS